MNNLEEIINEIAHLLPSPGPLEVFVHHNTLHAFENRPFLRGVEEAAEIYGSDPYLAESA